MRPRVIEIHEAVQDLNDRIASRNRARFVDERVFVINVMSAPGSGKTEFLCRTLADLSCAMQSSPVTGSCHDFSVPAGPPKLRMAVIVGDIATDNDARRLASTGAEVVQITTGGYCHLDAGMIAEAADHMDLSALDILIVENVGNMVCPATFDLGEDMRVALLSVTEGEDKPLKYPTLFKRADAIVVNKMDLAGACGYRREQALDNLTRIAPRTPIFEVSARTGDGMPDWYAFLRSRAAHGGNVYV